MHTPTAELPLTLTSQAHSNLVESWGALKLAYRDNVLKKLIALPVGDVMEIPEKYKEQFVICVNYFNVWDSAHFGFYVGIDESNSKLKKFALTGEELILVK